MLRVVEVLSVCYLGWLIFNLVCIGFFLLACLLRRGPE